MNINFVLLRQITVLSMFFGLILGALTLIPYIGILSLIFLICFVAPLVIFILIKYNCMTLNSTKNSIITGTISGFTAYIGFSLIYIPISVFLIKFFNLAANYGIGLMLNNANFFILVILSLFMGVLAATVNAFSGFITFCILDFLNSIK